jgi:hypothetical protein
VRFAAAALSHAAIDPETARQAAARRRRFAGDRQQRGNPGALSQENGTACIFLAIPIGSAQQAVAVR